MVPKAGLEPARGLSSVDFESTASTDFATSARFSLLNYQCDESIVSKEKKKCQYFNCNKIFQFSSNL